MPDDARKKRRDGEGRLDEDRGVFMISVAAELAEMHPQTLRMYEARGLITPKRSPKNTRLYSQSDVERLRKSIGGELVPYGAYDPPSMQPDQGSTRIPIRRRPH
jgi:MerR-like DNA binding protein